MTVGQRIKQLRRQKGWTQEKAGEKMGIGWQALSNIERGKTDLPLSRLLQIAKVFKVTPSELLDDQVDHLRKELQRKDEEIASLKDRLLDCMQKKRK